MLSNVKSSLVKLILLGISVTILVNFSVSLLIWLGYIWHVSTSEQQVNWPYLLHAIPALILFLTSLATFYLLLLKKRRVVFLFLLTIILSVCCFIYETHYDKWCYGVSPVFVSGPDPYNGIGFRYRFVNWWWYEKDVIITGDFNTIKVFHHFFGKRSKGYISSSSLMYIGDMDKVEDAVELTEQN